MVDEIVNGVVSLRDQELQDFEVTRTLDYLVAHPDSVTEVDLGGNCLTDESGEKLAMLVMKSTTLSVLLIDNNCFGSKTFMALAFPCMVTPSLKKLSFHNNLPVYSEFIERLNDIMSTK